MFRGRTSTKEVDDQLDAEHTGNFVCVCHVSPRGYSMFKSMVFLRWYTGDSMDDRDGVH